MIKREAVIVLRHDLKNIAFAVNKLIKDCDDLELEIERRENEGRPDSPTK